MKLHGHFENAILRGEINVTTRRSSARYQLIPPLLNEESTMDGCIVFIALLNNTPNVALDKSKLSRELEDFPSLGRNATPIFIIK